MTYLYTSLALPKLELREYLSSRDIIKNLTSRVADLQKQIQFSAHIMRPLTHGISGSFCLKDFAEALAATAQLGYGNKVLQIAYDLME